MNRDEPQCHQAPARRHGWPRGRAGSAVTSRGHVASTAIALSAVAAAASCTTPREERPTIPPVDVQPTPPTWCNNVEASYQPRWVNGTVSTTFTPDGPVLVAGDRLIQPDEDTRRVIGAAGVEEVTGSLEVCSDADGVPVKVTLTRSTQYAAYDQALAEGARRWRFIPPQVRGEYVSSCTQVQLTYRPWRD